AKGGGRSARATKGGAGGGRAAAKGGKSARTAKGRASSGRAAKSGGKSARTANGRGRGSTAARTDARDDLAGRSKAELYRRAQELDVPGRSEMTRPQLIQAIRRAS